LFFAGRETQAEQGALAGIAFHLERPAEELGALAHAGQAVTGRVFPATG
jgi:hypothetical protein